MRNQILLLILAISAIIYFSCHKSSVSFKVNRPSTNAELIVDAQKYFIENVRGRSTTCPHNSFNHVMDLQRTINWGMAKVVQLSKTEAIVIPISFSDNTGKSNLSYSSKQISINSVSRLVMYKDANQKYHTEIISAYPDTTSYLIHKGNFLGLTTVQNWDGSFIKGFNFQKNKTTYLTLNGNNSQSGSTRSDISEQYTTICTWLDWYWCTEYGCTYEYSELIGCYTESQGGNGSGGDETVNNHEYQQLSSDQDEDEDYLVDTIVMLLTDPCLQSAANRVLYGSYKPDMTAIMNQFDCDENLELSVIQHAVSQHGEDAYTAESLTGDYCHENIYLNLDKLKGASQEFVAETIFHESIHALLNVNGAIKNELQQHKEMINNYVNIEQTALQTIYPSLSTHDALCLILGGMGDVQEYDSTTLTTVAANYDLTLEDVQTTNDAYKHSSKGTPCDNLN